MIKSTTTAVSIRAVRRSLLLAGIGLILLPAGVLVASVMANVDASWGAVAGGGISHAALTVVDAIGESASGTSASQSAIVEAGVLALPLGDAASVAGKQWLYLPEVVK